MTILIRQLTAAEAWAYADELAGIYASAFGYDHERAQQFRDDSLKHGLHYDGALLLAAYRESEIVGFLFGYTYSAAHWWPIHVGPRLVAEGHSSILNDAFELVELEVLPDYQGQGIGTRLVRALMDRTPHNHILLNTSADQENRAIRFYERLGFRALVKDFQYLEFGDFHNIMGWSRPITFPQFAF